MVLALLPDTVGRLLLVAVLDSVVLTMLMMALERGYGMAPAGGDDDDDDGVCHGLKGLFPHGSKKAKPPLLEAFPAWPE